MAGYTTNCLSLSRAKPPQPKPPHVEKFWALRHRRSPKAYQQYDNGGLVAFDTKREAGTWAGAYCPGLLRPVRIEVRTI